MLRTATYSIKGYLYQFIKTLQQVIQLNNNEFVICEGIVEDIDIFKGEGNESVQCKYHENKKYTLSTIFEPLLQMMNNFAENREANLKYFLFAYFPHEKRGTRQLKESDCIKCLNSNNASYRKMIHNIRQKGIDLNEFLKKFSLIIGPSYEELVAETKSELEKDFQREEIESFIFPNLIYEISQKSVMKSLDQRKVSKNELFSNTANNKTLLINKWIKELRDFDKIISTKRKMLRDNLSQNYRRRAFIFDKGFNTKLEQVICFIDDYIKKYAYKPRIHTNFEPIFCFDMNEEEFEQLVIRLKNRELKPCDGYTRNTFYLKDFLNKPFVTKINNDQFDKSYHLRVLNRKNIQALNSLLVDDYYFLTLEKYEELTIKDTNVEVLILDEIPHINYLFQLRGSYE